MKRPWEASTKLLFPGGEEQSRNIMLHNCFTYCSGFFVVGEGILKIAICDKFLVHKWKEESPISFSVPFQGVGVRTEAENGLSKDAPPP